MPEHQRIDTATPLATAAVVLGALLLLVATATPAVAQQTLFFSSDIPTDPSTGSLLEPADVVQHVSGSYAVQFNVPGIPSIEAVDAVEKRVAAPEWLVSLRVPHDPAGHLGALAQPHDVILFNGATYSLYFDGDGIASSIPLGANVDAIYQEGGDNGDLVMSFDIPVEVPPGSGTIAEPSDLVRYTPGGGGPTDWSLVGVDFVAAAAGAGIPPTGNVVGADRIPEGLALVFDTPTALSPSIGPPIYEPGQVTLWDGTRFSFLDSLGNWPVTSRVDALSCGSGSVVAPRNPTAIRLERSISTPGDVTISWQPSCSVAAVDYGVYEGTLVRPWAYNHGQIDCLDDGGDLQEDVTPSALSTYYLVVAQSLTLEGTYGENSFSNQRPQAAVPANRCLTTQIVDACP